MPLLTRSKAQLQAIIINAVPIRLKAQMNKINRKLIKMPNKMMLIYKFITS
jgi:hypothetical protein